MDFETIAKKYGATSTTTPVQPTVDFSNIASKYGASVSTVPNNQPPVDEGFAKNYINTYTSIANQIKEPIKALGSALISSEKGVGETLGQSIASGSSDIASLETSKQNLSNLQLTVLKEINDKKKKGEDTSRLEQILTSTQNLNIPSTQDILPATQKTTGQAIGELGGTALDVLTAGTYGTATKGLKAFELATQSKLTPTIVENGIELLKSPTGIFSVNGLKNIATGAGIGYGYDVSQGLQGQRGEDRTGVDSLIPGLGTVISAGIPAIVESTGAVRNLFSQQKYLKDLQSDWERVSGDFSKSRKILAKSEISGKDPISLLTERGITPQSMIDGQTGLFDTREVANKIRTKDTEPFEEVLQKSLKEADMSNTPLNLKEVSKTIKNNINNADNLSVGQKKLLLDKVDNEFSLLNDKYKNNISRSDSNIEKRVYWNNTNFNRLDPVESNFFYQMGKGFKEAIEKGTPDVNIKELNSYLGELYNSAQLLDSINGYKPKITAIQKFQRAVVKGASTYIGAKLGGLPGGAVAYITGNSLSHALETLPNPVKNYFLRNLKATNPEAYNQAVKYLGEKEIERSIRLALPSPEPLGTSKNPIITPAPTTYEKPAQIIRRYDNGVPKNKGFSNIGVITSIAGISGVIGALNIPRKITFLNDEGKKETIKLDGSVKEGEFTSYNPVEGQTDSTPNIMASGKKVYDGAIATGDRSIPFGTKVYVPELDRVFIVEDRMNKRYMPDQNNGKQFFDIVTATGTKEDVQKSKNFGRQKLHFIILNK